MDSEKTSKAIEGRLFELSLDLLCTARFDGYLERVNPAFTRVLGHSSEEFLACPFLEFVHPDDRASTLQELDRLREGRNTVEFDTRYRHKDGSYRCLTWSATPVQSEELRLPPSRGQRLRNGPDNSRQDL